MATFDSLKKHLKDDIDEVLELLNEQVFLNDNLDSSPISGKLEDGELGCLDGADISKKVGIPVSVTAAGPMYDRVFAVEQATLTLSLATQFSDDELALLEKDENILDEEEFDAYTDLVDELEQTFNLVFELPLAFGAAGFKVTFSRDRSGRMQTETEVI